jgi:hypothetical protein
MKSKCIATLLLLVSISSFAQEKKPQPYSFGIGYGISFISNDFSSPNQSINLSVWFPKNLELTFPFSFNYYGSKSTIIDSPYTVTNSGYRMFERTTTNQYKTFGISISPGLLYHFPVKSNLDIYLGFSVPIGVLSYITNNIVEETKGSDYLNKITTTVKAKPLVTASGQITFGCNYFFYKNLAIGAKASLYMNFNNSQQPYLSKTITIENSGSDNPSQNYSSFTQQSNPRNKFTNQSIGFNGGGGLYLNYYFGMKSSKKEPTVN